MLLNECSIVAVGEEMNLPPSVVVSADDGARRQPDHARALIRSAVMLDSDVGNTIKRPAVEQHPEGSHGRANASVTGDVVTRTATV
jgi:hypothetical protein